MKLYKSGFPFPVYQSIGMDPESFHHSKRTWNSTVGHSPHEHVGRFRHQRCEIPECIVCSLGLGEAAIGLRLRCMDQIGKFDRILNEEDWNVISYQVPITFFRVELDGESSNIAREIG